MSREVVESSEAPKAVGPYSQAIRAEGLIFCSGQIPMDLATGALVQGSIEEATERCLLNLAAVLRAGGAALDDVVQTTVFLADMADFAGMNEVYSRFFPSEPPARVCVEVSTLPKGARIEIAAVAVHRE